MRSTTTPSAGELARVVATVVVVVGTLAAMLGVADAVPRWLGGVPAGIVRVGSVADAQKHVRAKLLLPPYFPDTLAWPPARVEVLLGPPPAVVLGFTGRDGAGERLVIVQTLAGGPPPAELWPAMTRLTSSLVTLSGGDAELWRVLGADGAFWQELEITVGGRRVGLRSQGSIEDLVRMARSLEHERP